MNKIIYLIRHCQATGQAADAPLTSEGIDQAETLAEFLLEAQIGQIVSSPFARAIESINPLSIRLNIEIKLDERLIEAALSTIDYSDWLDKLRETFSDFEISFKGGESSRTATTRAVAAINDALLLDTDSIVVVTHGRLLTLILKHFDSKYGFEEWRNLTTPDVFRIVIKENEFQADRIWQ
ncbi:MAG TPA: histidine phosphatase family protein [Pyrinomonadaceae bacterium]|jgi:2,3-bisphosphoglycerate-dependent phosphoglycerate mutase